MLLKTRLPRLTLPSARGVSARTSSEAEANRLISLGDATTAYSRWIDAEVREVNKTVARVETIKKFRLIPRRFYAEDGDVTPTQKVKRRNIAVMYKDLIDGMYRGGE